LTPNLKSHPLIPSKLDSFLLFYISGRPSAYRLPASRRGGELLLERRRRSATKRCGGVVLVQRLPIQGVARSRLCDVKFGDFGISKVLLFFAMDRLRPRERNSFSGFTSAEIHSAREMI
ncbi:hypothetical protein V2J09_021258, partial [Rumex salicifolius]